MQAKEMRELDDPQVTLPDLFATHAAFQPDKEAIVCGATRRTWGAFDRGMNLVANALLRAGLGKGDKGAVLMGNSVEMLETTFGVVKAGCCVVPLSGLLTGDQLARLIDDSGASIVFVSAEFRDRIAPHRAALTRVAAERWIAFDFEEPDWTPCAAFLDGAADTQPPVTYAQDDDFNIIYSSGTTGLPKGIVQTHRARLHFAFSNAVEMGFTSAARALTTTALYSNGTWLMVLPALFAGGTLVALPTFSPQAFLQAVEAEKITHTFMVPPQYIMVLAEPRLQDFDLSGLRTMLSAGSPLRSDTKRAILSRMGAGLYELYGYSEGFATMLKPDRHADKFSTVGTPVIGFEIRILGEDDRALPRETAGEIAGYGAGMMKGYHNNREATAALVWRDERGRSFIRSGDVGVLDADGFLTILDRKKDMIISGGFNVFPSDIEEIVGGHPAVADVTVVGIPDNKWGETVLALVIAKDGASASAEEIRTWANARLAKHQRVAALEFRDEFPRNALGKVLKRVLREPYWAKFPSPRERGEG